MWRKRRRREKRAYKNEYQDQPIVKLVSEGRKKKNSSRQNNNCVLTSCIKKSHCQCWQHLVFVMKMCEKIQANIYQIYKPHRCQLNRFMVGIFVDFICTLFSLYCASFATTDKIHKDACQHCKLKQQQKKQASHQAHTTHRMFDRFRILCVRIVCTNV